MSANVPALVPKCPRARSRLTNSPSRLLFGDGRSAGARRLRDLVNAYAAELGGLDALPVSAQQIVRRLAQVSVELELLEAQRAAGTVIDPVAYGTLSNAQRRFLRDLQALKSGYEPKQPTLRDHLEKTYGNRAEAAPV